MKAALFVPCYVDAFFPEVGIATLELLERLGVEVVYPLDQTCCGQPMGNSGCQEDAAATEALFVKNFAGFDYVVSPSGSCTHHVRENLTAIPQTAQTVKVRQRTYELVEFVHDVLNVREFPWAEFPHAVGLHNGCASLRALRTAKMSEIAEPSFSKPLDLLSGVKGIRFVMPERPDECCGFGGTFSVFEEPVSAKMGYDKVTDHQKAGAEYIVSGDMSCVMHQKGCAERLGLPIKFIHIAQILNGAPGMKRIDHAEGSSKFIKAKDHLDFHDKRLWDLRKKRDRESEHLPEWEELRSLASAIKEHTLTHLADYLEEFERNATKNGAQVHWAKDAAEHNQIVLDIMSARGARTLVKAKSMLTDECDMRPFLENRGIEVMETDLGERIQQLDDEPPSHIVVPAVHKLRTDVARVFSQTIGTDPKNSDVHYLAESQRQHTRPYFLKADAGMTGANFAVAETGTVVVCTNEGNADLSVNLPKLYIASIGIEKIIPRIEHLGVFVRMLSRSALGSPITQLTSHFRAPRDGTEMHIVLVDNGRSERLGMSDFWYSLKCIRCGACMNTCPVYRRSGGLSYGATYSGPIGVIIDPTFNLRKYSSLPFASTLNGSCTSVCPVRINIHEQIYKWRQIIAERHQLPFVKQEAMKVAGKVLSNPKAYRAVVEGTSAGIEHLPRFMMYSRFNAWGRQREVPEAPQYTFRQWYIENRGKR